MNTYKVKVCMSYIHEMEVQADTKDEALDLAFDSFDLSKAYMGDGDCYLLEINGVEQ